METKSTVSKIIIVVALLVAIVCVVYYKNQKKESPHNIIAQKTILPRLLDLGAGKCIPCKMMEPVLEELRKEYQGKLEVVFIDVWKNLDAEEHYGIKLIPTQIFYDSSGKELYRHEGFFAKEDILKKWKELGIDLQK